MRELSLRRAGGAAAALLAVFAACAVVSGSAASAAGGPTAAEPGASTTQSDLVKSAFHAAMAAREAVLIPNSNVEASGALTATDLRAQINAGSKDLNRVFAPVAAAHEMIGLRSAVSAEADGSTQILGGGVSNVTYKDVSVAGSTAHVHADVTTWLHFKDRQRATGPWLDSQPIGVLDAHAVLTEDAAGRWRVASLDWDFAPGSGP